MPRKTKRSTGHADDLPTRVCRALGYKFSVMTDDCEESDCDWCPCCQYQRVLAFVEAEVGHLRNETARIILQAEETSCPDGHTSCVKFSKEMLDELRSLIA